MKVNKKTFNRSSIKRVVGKFHVVVVQNNGREMYKKSFLRVQTAFLLITWDYIRCIKGQTATAPQYIPVGVFPVSATKPDI